MDNFTEQLVKIKFGTARIIATVVTYLFGVVASALLFWISFIIGFPALGFLAVCGIMFVSWRSAGQFRLEYEYSVTNGEFDIDSIVNERKRQRSISFSCADIESMKKYTKGEPVPESIGTKIFACTPDEDSYSLIVKKKDGSRAYIVISPNEAVLDSVKKFMPSRLRLEVFGGIR